jgi:cellulase/cellobiase CelA1
MTEQEVKELMLSSTSETQWNQNCDKVKAANEGDYPRFWYVTIVLGGVLQEAKQKNGW